MRTLVLLLAVLASAPAWADVVMDPGDDKWAKPPPERGDKGKVTVGGANADTPPEPEPPVPYPVSVGISLAADVGGFVLLIPQLSTDHVLGWRTGANRTLGYLGLGTLVLSCALGFGLSGGSLGTVIMAPIIESALIGAAFGMALLANLALHAETSTIGSIAVNDLVGIPLVVLSIPFIAAAALFPIFCALVPGNALSGSDEKEFAPLDAVGFLPVRGGGIVSVGFTLPL